MTEKPLNHEIIELKWEEFQRIRQGIGVKPRELQQYLEQNSINISAKTITGYETKRYGRMVEFKYIQILRDMVGDKLFDHHYQQYFANPNKYVEKYIPQFYC